MNANDSIDYKFDLHPEMFAIIARTNGDKGIYRIPVICFGPSNILCYPQKGDDKSFQLIAYSYNDRIKNSIPILEGSIKTFNSIANENIINMLFSFLTSIVYETGFRSMFGETATNIEYEKTLQKFHEFVYKIISVMSDETSEVLLSDAVRRFVYGTIASTGDQVSMYHISHIIDKEIQRFANRNMDDILSEEEMLESTDVDWLKGLFGEN